MEEGMKESIVLGEKKNNNRVEEMKREVEEMKRE